MLGDSTVYMNVRFLLLGPIVYLANSTDPDEMPHTAVFHQGLYCLLKQSSEKIIECFLVIVYYPDLGPSIHGLVIDIGSCCCYKAAIWPKYLSGYWALLYNFIVKTLRYIC